MIFQFNFDERYLFLNKTIYWCLIEKDKTPVGIDKDFLLWIMAKSGQ